MQADIVRRNRRSARLAFLVAPLPLAVLLAFIAFLFAWGQGYGAVAGLAVGSVVGGIVVAFLASAIAWVAAPRIVASAIPWRPLDPTDRVERLWRQAVEELSLAAGIRTPEVGVVDRDGANAFAWGRGDRAWVVATRDALDDLDSGQREALAAHCVARIHQEEAQTTTAVLAATGLAAWLGLWWRQEIHRIRTEREMSVFAFWLIPAAPVLLLTPLVARLAALQLRRSRLYWTDQEAVRLARNRAGLERLLRRDLRETVGSGAWLADATGFYPPRRMDGPLTTHPALSERLAWIQDSETSIPVRQMLHAEGT